MNDPNDLDDIFQKFDAAQDQAKARSAQKQSEDKTLLETFAAHIHNEIEPRLTAIGHQVRTHGHDYDVRVHDSNYHIAFLFFPKNIPRDAYQRDGPPHITFAWDTLRRKVFVHHSTMTPQNGGVGGPMGHFDLAEVDATLIKKLTTKVIAETLEPYSKA